MSELEFLATTSVSKDVNTVDLESAGLNNQDKGLLMLGSISAYDDVGRRGKRKLDFVTEEFEALTKRVEILERRNANVISSDSPKQPDLRAELPNPVPAYLANFPISARLRKAFEFLSICKSDHVYKGSSGFTEETTKNRVDFAESLVNAEILLELVRTKKELQRMKDSLRDIAS